MPFHILRQALVYAGLVISSIGEGMVVGQISGMIAGLQSNDSDIILSEEVISWIASTTVAASLIGLSLAALVSNKYGRGKAITLLTMPIIITWIMIYYGNSAAVFITTRAIVGIFSGGILVTLFIATGEYAPSHRRLLYLYVVTSVAFTFGTTLSHILCVLFHWRTVALISIVPPIISSILPYFWVESPSWLASKGRFEESEVAFRALYGHSESADVELNLLINIEKIKQGNSQREGKNGKSLLYKSIILLTKKSFWNLCCLSVAAVVYKTAAGKYFFITLAITMLQDLTGSGDILYFTLVVDGFFLIGTCLSCLLISRIKMRTLLFSSGAISVIVLVILTTCIYFKLTVVINFAWTKCILLALYFITINAGPYPVLDGLIAEIYPLELKEYYMFLFGIVQTIAVFLNLKYALVMVSTLGYHGVFLLNIVFVVASLVYMWFRLPETKGRTLQEIELFFENNTFQKVDQIKRENDYKDLVSLTNSERKDRIDSKLEEF